MKNKEEQTKTPPRGLPNVVNVDKFSIHRCDYEVIVHDKEYLFQILETIFNGNYDVFVIPSGEHYCIAGEVLYSYYPKENI